ncbi:DUF2637 domain-containing protein (plasmid) [Thermobifida halotolerans]|uniref:DUF2637 domain-containing protein n=1 Tax=Thermobifida halotolerans TaxID=483545 RepID=A0A399FW67_9ACTN|nr:DUF2637 domain-containing protein [Thermobifida halotolerans]UOE22256.1 DUF2637 domain-containing protein [Thermobifida halotolerans]
MRSEAEEKATHSGPGLSRSDWFGVVVVLAAALLFVTVAFAMSYASLYKVAGWLRSTPLTFVNGGDLRFLFPLVLDGLIVYFMALDLWTEWRRIRHPYYRWVAYMLAMLTLVLNVSSAEQGEGWLAHVAPPLGVILISEGLAIWVRSMSGLHRSQPVSDRIPLGHWVTRPASATRIMRLMWGWNIRSYDEAVEMDRQRCLAYAMLKQQYGRKWRRQTPSNLLWMLDNGHDLKQSYELVKELTPSVPRSRTEAARLRRSGQVAATAAAGRSSTPPVGPAAGQPKGQGTDTDGHLATSHPATVAAVDGRTVGQPKERETDTDGRMADGHDGHSPDGQVAATAAAGRSSTPPVGPAAGQPKEQEADTGGRTAASHDGQAGEGQKSPALTVVSSPHRSERLREVVELLRSNPDLVKGPMQEIDAFVAERLGMAPRTARRHRTQAMAVLERENRDRVEAGAASGQ